MDGKANEVKGEGEGEGEDKEPYGLYDTYHTVSNGVTISCTRPQREVKLKVGGFATRPPCLRTRLGLGRF